jgi:hypothetical protein
MRKAAADLNPAAAFVFPLCRSSCRTKVARGGNGGRLMEHPRAKLSVFGVYHGDLVQALCKQSDRLIEVVAPSGQAPRQHRVSRVRLIENTDPLFLGRNIGVKDLNGSVKGAYQLLKGLSLFH